MASKKHLLSSINTSKVFLICKEVVLRCMTVLFILFYYLFLFLPGKEGMKYKNTQCHNVILNFNINKHDSAVDLVSDKAIAISQRVYH